MDEYNSLVLSTQSNHASDRDITFFIQLKQMFKDTWNQLQYIYFRGMPDRDFSGATLIHSVFSLSCAPIEFSEISQNKACSLILSSQNNITLR